MALIVMSCGFTVRAETVSQKEAANIAHLFFNQAAGRMTAKPKLVWNGKRLTTDRLFSPFYVYNSPAGGFVMISAENKAFPILAYSLKSSFDPDAISDAEKAFFADYARDIEHIRYVSDVPEQAIEAWTDIPDYIVSVLDERYESTDPDLSVEQVSAEVEAMTVSSEADRLASDMYTQSQWSGQINSDLESGRQVLLGIVSYRGVTPAVIHGRKGDYYRVRFDRANDWLLRLNPSEIFSGWQIAGLSRPIVMPEVEEEAPFAFYEGFIAETERENIARERELQLALAPESPIIKSIGGGRFEIDFPEKVNLARIYNVSGAMIGQYTYRDTMTGHVDLGAEPSGFYVALFRGESGRPYGLKLYR